MALDPLRPDQVQRLDDIFRALDLQGEGVIGPRELGLTFRLIGVPMTEAELQDIINEVGGKLDAHEFKHLMMRKFSDCNTVGEVQKAFTYFDKDGDGQISLQDAQKTFSELGMNLCTEEAQELVREADLNDDGKVSKLEFSKVIL